MNQPFIDPNVFKELQDAMGIEFADELLETFLNDAANMFADLNQAVSEDDIDRYRRASHSIKSNAQTFGAHVLADQARDMELSGTIDIQAAEALRTAFTSTAQALEGLKDA